MPSSFLLQYSNVNAAAVIASGLDYFITEGDPGHVSDPQNATPAMSDAEVASAQAAGTEIYGYVNLCVVDDARPYWNPAWTSDGTDQGTVNPTAPEWLKGQPSNGFGYIADFSDPAWKQIVISQAVELVSRGYAGVFLDDLAQYYISGVTGATIQQQATAMMEFVIELDAAIRAENPAAKIIVNGDPYIVTNAVGGASSAESVSFLAAVDGFLMESFFGVGGAAQTAAVEHALTYIAPHIELLALEFGGTSSQNYFFTQNALALGVAAAVSASSAYSSFGAPIAAPTGGADSLIGTKWSDTIFGLGGADTVMGGEGNDTIKGGAGADSLDGGADSDTLDYSDATTKVTVRLWNQTATGDVATGDMISGFESARGGSAGDAIVGSDAVNNRLVGNGGADNIQGLSGNDTLEGNAGNDTLKGGIGADVMSGGADSDTLDYSDSSSGVKVRLWNQTVTDGLATGDTIAGMENAIGGASTDALVGSNGVANLLSGNGGNDNMQGLSGNDTLIGGAGRDTMTGGADADTFQFAGAWGIDRITDFEGGAGAGDVLSFIGLGAAYDSFAEILAITTQSGANTIINFGSGKTITLLGFNMANLNADDFAFG
jgi:uncharacterized protein (TIGR01370 family)